MNGSYPPMAGDPYTGKELYDAYVHAMDRRGVAVESWEELDDVDREAWEEIASTHTGM